ncbi:thiamine pyrophosphate-binding protein [Brevibacterium sp. GP-SGM9]|uniref:thiamine pyrophosphate-binding protein n=1 Tax=Brevibacterium sp. GP-SGM9 TaxID=3376990 RepID=UPI0039A60859
MSNSSAVAQQIARALVASSVTDVVIAPGSRSAPLIYALAPLAEAGLIRTHVRIDERDAGFLALGLARGLRAARGREAGAASESGSNASGAVAIITTSGSAVANLHPAILEASYGRLPLIAITADRPARLRGTEANQTIDDQSRVLSDVRARFDVPALGGSDSLGGGKYGKVGDVETWLAEAVGRAVGEIGGVGQRASGPVQFNVQFDVPLVPSEEELGAWKCEIEGLRHESGGEPDTGAEPAPTHRLRITEATVIAGGDAGGHPADSLRQLAEAHSLPVLAEPSSPLSFDTRGSRTFVPAHAEVLSQRAELRAAVDTVIVHGKPTLTRPVAALLADEGVQIQRLPDDVDALRLEVKTEAPSSAGADAIDGAPARPDRAQWCRKWTEAGQELVARSTEPASRARAITERLAASPITLFVASSNSVRYLSKVTEVRAHIHASRGLAGIDGLVSTATGLSLGLGDHVVLLIGDVAMLHDVGGLLTPSSEEVGDVTIVILNDDGGAIFSGLEHSQGHVEQYLERYFTVPHGRRFDALAAAFGWDYAKADDADAVMKEIERPKDGGPVRRIIEVAIGE